MIRDAFMSARQNVGDLLTFLMTRTTSRVAPTEAAERLLRTVGPRFEEIDAALGYHLYYPSRRQPTPAFVLLVDALRYRRNP